jgi:signal transduction histidine kinase
MADGSGLLPGHNEQVNGMSMPRPWQAFGPAEQLERAKDGLRRAAAFVASVEPRSRPTARAIAVDVVLAAVATVALLVALGKTSASQQPSMVLGPDGPTFVATAHGLVGWHEIVLAMASAAPLALRRLWPLTAFWVILGAVAVTPGYRETVITVIVMIGAAYSAVAYSRFRGATMLCVPASGMLVTAAFHGAVAPRMTESGAAVLGLGAILMVGNAMHSWRRKAGDSQARLAGLQAEHEAATRRALELERARIAGELHDVVTHNVSVMIVQAGAARQVLAAAPDQARSAMLAVEASGRAAMTELRHLLGLLGPPPSADGGTSGGGARASQDLRPQPGLGQLRPLVDRVAAAGLPVQLQVGDVPAGIPPGPDLAAFRVVQEALTNVIKHAGKPRTRVSVDYRDGDLFVEVADTGPPAAAPSVGPPGLLGLREQTDTRPPIAAPGPTPPGTGRGLLGLRERMALYGGELDAGPGQDGGWLVRARIPADLLPAGPPVS